MKISFFVRWLPPRPDGVGCCTWNLANALRACGVDISLFASQDQGGKGLEQNEWVLPIIKQWQPKEVIEALKTVAVSAPDWFCFQYVPQMYGRYGICWQIADILWALKKEFRCKVAVTFHEFISGWGLNLRDILLASITRLQTRRILSAVDLAITTCQRYKNDLRQLWPHPLKIEVIPVGACIEPVEVTTEEGISLRRQYFPPTARILGLFSRLHPARNSSLAMKVLQRACQGGIDAWLLMGDVESAEPKLFADLMQLADKLGVKSRVVIYKEDLSTALRAVDLFLFTQIDGISTRNTTLMAALAFGLPVVSFKPYPGNFDSFYIPCGILVDRGDEEGFIQAAVECLKNSDNLRDAAFANRDYYYNNFSWTILAKRYFEALGT